MMSSLSTDNHKQDSAVALHSGKLPLSFCALESWKKSKIMSLQADSEVGYLFYKNNIGSTPFSKRLLLQWSWRQAIHQPFNSAFYLIWNWIYSTRVPISDSLVPVQQKNSGALLAAQVRQPVYSGQYQFVAVHISKYFQYFTSKHIAWVVHKRLYFFFLKSP